MITDSFKNLLLTYGGTQATHIGLVNNLGVELSGGSYARKAASWGTASAGKMNLAADITFDVPAGATVAGWLAFSAASGGTNYGGSDLTPESFSNAGQYVLLSSGTFIALEDKEE